MDSSRRIAMNAGILFIIAMVAGVLSVAPAIDAPDYLIKASDNANQVLVGAFFQFLMFVVYVGIAITLYPVLRKYNESLALGFLCFRIIAGVFIIIGVVILLLLLTLSQEFVKAETPDLLYFQTLGNLLRNGRDFVNHVAMILAISIGGMMFYILLYQSKLVPRWLSVWGFSGTVLTICASLLVMFHIIDIITAVYIGLNVPMALLELVLAIWLIVKGFDNSVIKS